MTALGKLLAGNLTTMRLGRGGETTRFVCGYFGCERHADRLFLAGLPRMIKINLRGDPAGEWLESSVRHQVSQAGSRRPGQSVLLSKMAEALFIETIRRYMEALPPEQTGWLAGARDTVVGGALALLHRKPPASLDRRRTCRRGRDLALGSRREVLPLSRRAATDLPGTLAIAVGCEDAADDAGRGVAGGVGGRVRFRSGFQSRIQARVVFHRDSSDGRSPDRIKGSPVATIQLHPPPTRRVRPPVADIASLAGCPLCAPEANFPLLRSSPPCPAHRYFRPRGWSSLRLFPWHRRVGPYVPYQSLVELRRLHAGCRLGRLGTPPKLIPEEGSPPGFDIV